MTTTLAFAAAGWAILMGLSPILQVRLILRRRSSQGVSIGYFCVLLVGFALWLAYGAALGNLALIVPNAVALAMAVVTIAVARRFRTPRSPHE